MRETLVISNYWHKPGIKVSFVSDADSPKGGIQLGIPVADFIAAVAKETRTPLFTRAAVARALTVALEKIKESSTAGAV
jgi:hypothetical protein